MLPGQVAGFQRSGGQYPVGIESAALAGPEQQAAGGVHRAGLDRAFEHGYPGQRAIEVHAETGAQCSRLAMQGTHQQWPSRGGRVLGAGKQDFARQQVDAALSGVEGDIDGCVGV
ncbi:hypothetical protein D3C79_749220 [compost metagenome]